MKNILVFTPHFYPENQILNNLLFSLNKDYRFTVITSFPNYPKRSLYKEYKIFKDSYSSKFKNIKIIRLPVVYRKGDNKIFLLLNYLSYFIGSILIIPFLLFKKFDRIFIYLTSPFTISISPILISILKNTKVSIWVLDLWPETLFSYNFPFKKKIIELFYKITNFTYKRCDKILISSQKFSESLSLKKFKNKIYFSPQWATLISSKKKKINSNNYPKVKKNQFIILFAGNMGFAQNLSNLYKSIVQLKKEKDILWIFIGDGSEKEKFKNKLVKSYSMKNVLFFNHMKAEEIDYFYKISNAFLIPLSPGVAFNKVLPAKLHASISYGKPILTLSDGELSNFVKYYKIGLVAKSNEYKILVQNILKLRTYGEAELRKIKTRSRFIIHNIFDRNRIIHLIKNVCFD